MIIFLRIKYMLSKKAHDRTISILLNFIIFLKIGCANSDAAPILPLHPYIHKYMQKYIPNIELLTDNMCRIPKTFSPEKWSPGKIVRRKVVPGKNSPQKIGPQKMGSGKNGPRKIGRRKMVPGKK